MASYPSGTMISRIYEMTKLCDNFKIGYLSNKARYFLIVWWNCSSQRCVSYKVRMIDCFFFSIKNLRKRKEKKKGLQTFCC